MDLSRLKLTPHKLFHHLDEVVKWRNGEYFPPIYVELSPIDLCNQRCHYCYTQYLGHKKLEIPRELLLRIMSNLGEAGVKSVQIQGTGEPLLNKATPDAIVTAKKAGVDVALCSNGVLMDPGIADKCLSSLSFFRVSAIECNSKLYSKTHGCDESQYDRLIGNLKHVVKLREENKFDTVLAASFIPFPYNVERMYETAKMCRDIGLDYIHIKPAQISAHNPEHSWNRDTHIKFSDHFEKVKELTTKEFIVDVRYDQFECHEQKVFPKKFRACYGIEFETMIDADACIYPCLNFWRDPEYCLGDLSKMSFEEIWKSEHRRKVMDKIYREYNLENCHFHCKHSHINDDLWELANPPMHKNFL